MTFEDCLRVAGLLPRQKDLIPDGKIHRCPTAEKPHSDNGWFVWHSDGHGVYGDWAIQGNKPMGTWRDETMRDRAIDRLAIEQERKARRDAEWAERLEAMRGARAFWDTCQPVRGGHEYLRRKGLTPAGTTGLRVATRDATVIVRRGDQYQPAARAGDLIVPVMLRGRLASIQAIGPDGSKVFWPRTSVKAAAHVIGPDSAAVTVVCEGYATGLAVYQSMKHVRVLVAFDAGNLARVIEEWKPTGSVCIAADNDHKTAAKAHMHGVNPGIKAATAAAELIGAGVAYPEGIEGSDWADWLMESGERAGRKLERQILGAARYVARATAVP